VTTLPGITVPTVGETWFKCTARRPMFASATIRKVRKNGSVAVTLHGEVGPDGKPIGERDEAWELNAQLLEEWHPTLADAVDDLRNVLVEERDAASDIIAENDRDLILLSKWEEGDK